jgi:hypothetical protein
LAATRKIGMGKISIDCQPGIRYKRLIRGGNSAPEIGRNGEA